MLSRNLGGRDILLGVHVRMEVHEMSADPVRRMQHLVSNGYQRNFADGRGRLTIFSTASRSLIEELRPTKRNWVEEDFNSVLTADGQLDDSLEREFAKTEKSSAQSNPRY
jgi:hypothetical protein